MNILLIVIGSFLVIVGGLIWRYKILEIVPGYIEETIKDKKGLAKWIGINYIIMGLLIVINSIICLMIKQKDEIVSVIVFTGILCFFIIIISLGGNRYKK
ncbi:DUF3784 domain-containing protein [Mycoplasmatota bacterium]|nr:DUF3784 domain-containing protein [Mycoplasmatota bacterium]